MLIAIATLALASAPVPAAQAPIAAVDVGRFDEAAFPQAAMRERRLAYEPLMTRVEGMLRDRRCRFEGQSYRSFDLRVPYVVHLQPDGTATRIIVADMGCQPLESLVGQYVLQLARLRDFQPTGTGQPKWYRSELRFIAGNPD